ncbi:MAG: TIGR00730 family Rossman fold protein [Oscillospiraceae bacterium]|nr:TIGR00730 family Rossman fold protein [Oscillospiraceae bacterium]
MNICIYGASGDNIAPVFFAQAEQLGTAIAARGHTLVFGGGKTGLMGACARGVSAGGGRIIGIAPRFFDEPGVLYEACTEMIYTESMRERKFLMEEKSDAFIVLPGGIGTFEEFFETLTLNQLGRMSKPIVLYNTAGYYDRMLALLTYTADTKFMSASVQELYSVASTPEEAMEAIRVFVPISQDDAMQRMTTYNK